MYGQAHILLAMGEFFSCYSFIVEVMKTMPDIDCIGNSVHTLRKHETVTIVVDYRRCDFFVFVVQSARKIPRFPLVDACTIAVDVIREHDLNAFETLKVKKECPE